MGHDQRPDGHRWHSSPKIRFAPDSPLEGSGFEPSVPLRECRRSEPLARKETSGVGNGVSSTAEPMVRIWFPPAESQAKPLAWQRLGAGTMVHGAPTVHLVRRVVEGLTSC